jgi:hypothetical protein
MFVLVIPANSVLKDLLDGLVRKANPDCPARLERRANLVRRVLPVRLVQLVIQVQLAIKDQRVRQARRAQLAQQDHKVTQVLPARRGPLLNHSPSVSYRSETSPALILKVMDRTSVLLPLLHLTHDEGEYMKYALRAGLIALVLLIMGAAAAGAQVVPDGNASPDTPVSAVFTVNNTLVTLITGLVVPLVVALLARASNPAWVKIGLNAAVSAVATSFLSAVQDDGTAVLSQEWFVQAGVIFAASIMAYLGVWNPLASRQGGINTAMGPGVIPIESK